MILFSFPTIYTEEECSFMSLLAYMITHLCCGKLIIKRWWQHLAVGKLVRNNETYLDLNTRQSCTKTCWKLQMTSDSGWDSPYSGTMALSIQPVTLEELRSKHCHFNLIWGNLNSLERRLDRSFSLWMFKASWDRRWNACSCNCSKGWFYAGGVNAKAQETKDF